MHKKGITEEVAKKRSRKTVKHQRGIVGADIAAITAKRNQTAAVRQQQRLAAITKAKTEKKDKESKKEKEKSTKVYIFVICETQANFFPSGSSNDRCWPEGVEAADEGWRGQGSDDREKILIGFVGCSIPVYARRLISLCLAHEP